MKIKSGNFIRMKNDLCKLCAPHPEFHFPIIEVISLLSCSRVSCKYLSLFPLCKSKFLFICNGFENYYNCAKNFVKLTEKEEFIYHIYGVDGVRGLFE